MKFMPRLVFVWLIPLTAFVMVRYYNGRAYYFQKLAAEYESICDTLVEDAHREYTNAAQRLVTIDGYRRIIKRHGILVIEDECGVVLELAPEVSNPEKKTEEPQS